eukprot:7885924-Prorocentrum_lima.AAC.1
MAQPGPRLLASRRGIMPPDTDTWTLARSKPFISSSSRARAWIPSSIALPKVALVTPQPCMVYAPSNLDLGVATS